MSTVGLFPLLWQAVNDGAVYSALVPWILDARQQAPTLSSYIQQRGILQHQQLQAPNAVPRDMRLCILGAVGRSCVHARSLSVDECTGKDKGDDTKACSSSATKQGLVQPGSISNTCSLARPAANLAKLHGHMLAHGLVPDLSEQLQSLMLLLTSAPLEPTKHTAPANSSSRIHNSASKQKQRQQALSTDGAFTAAVAEGNGPVASPEQLIACRACAARYAAKALECCSKLLCCMPEDVVQGLAANPHLQQYASGLAARLTKAAESSRSAATLSRNTTVVGSSSQQASLDQQQHQTPYTPAASALGVVDSSRTAASASAGLGSAGGPWSGALGGRPPSGSGGAKLSGLGMLVHNTPGSAGGRSTGGQGSAVRANNAAVCNREKSRDNFFSILRRCSSRLEALRQQQAAAASMQDHQQQAAAAAVFHTELQELVSEVGLAAKQLLLQLAPSNQVYLAELFTACVLQAASTGEPILEPQLALMAERDPGKFQKLQQRLADRTGVPGAVSPVVLATLAAATGPGSHQQSAGQLNRPSPAGPSAGRATVQRVIPQSLAPAQQQQANGLAGPQLQQQQQANGPSGGSHSHKRQGRPVAQGLAATGLMHKGMMPPSGSNSAGGGACRPLRSGTRRVQPTPSSTGGSTGNSCRLAAAAGLNTPVPFGAGAAGLAPGASPLLQSSTGMLPTASVDAAAAGVGDVTPVLQQQIGSSSTTRSVLRPSVSRVVQLSSNTTDAAAGMQGLLAGRAAGTGTLHRTPASAPAAGHTIAAATPVVTVAPGSVPLKAPNSAPHTAASAVVSAQQLGSTQVVQQLLADMPAGQHVLLLVLHASDSASFNRSLLNVMLPRTEQLLSSGPGSLAAAGGLGQQASAIVALAGYCSYLSFAAGAVQGGNASSTASSSNRHQPQQPLLQEQPVLDVASLLQRAADVPCYSSSDSSAADLGWRVALTVPFICSYLQCVQFNPSAASSAAVASVTQQLQALQGLPCMNSNHAAYGSLAACISSCLHKSGLLQQEVGVQPHTPADAGAVECQVIGLPQPQKQQQQQQDPQQDCANVVGLGGLSTEWWCSVLQQGSQFVDSTYWSICCPELQKLSSLLATTSAAAAPTAQREQQPKGPVSSTTRPSSGNSSKQPARPAAEAEFPLTKQAIAAPEDAAAAPGTTTAAAERGSTSPAGSTASLRHTTPLLLAPREPPMIEKPPAIITAALAEVKDPLRQQLQQAFLGQYSTDDTPVKMRDVLSLVSNILCANSLSLALCQGVPPVVQKHLDSMSQEVQEQLGPVGATGRVPLQGQELARAIHTICCKHSLPSVHAALESAMQQASHHADHAATAACTALLPADVPPAAAAAAAALVAASCKASCAQRLLQEVPVIAQSSLADQADELVRLVTRQWAMHSRITAPAAAAAPAAEAVPASSRTGAQAAAGGTETASKTARRINPVLVADAGTAAATDLQSGKSKPLALQQQQQQRQRQLKGNSAKATAAAGSPVGKVTQPSSHISPVEIAATATAASTAGLDSSNVTTSKGRHSAAAAAAAGVAPSEGLEPLVQVAGANAVPATCAVSSSGISKDSGIVLQVSKSNLSIAADAAAQAAGNDLTSASGSSSSTAASKPAGTAGPAVTVKLLSLTSSFKGPARSSARQVLDSMQQELADAVAQRSISSAVGIYLAAALNLLPRPSKQPADVSGNSSSACDRGLAKQQQQLDGSVQHAGQQQQQQQQEQLNSHQQPPSGAPGPWLDVASTAACAAQLLVAGVTANLYSLLELEQQLVILVDPQASLGFQQKKNTTGTTHSTMISSDAGLSLQPAVHVSSSGIGSSMSTGMQDDLHHLLAGAVVHAYLTNPCVSAFVWTNSSDNSRQHESGSAGGLQHFVSLPTVVMKAARTDKPAWLLRQLRQWMQDTTLGC